MIYNHLCGENFLAGDTIVEKIIVLCDLVQPKPSGKNVQSMWDLNYNLNSILASIFGSLQSIIILECFYWPTSFHNENALPAVKAHVVNLLASLFLDPCLPRLSPLVSLLNPLFSFRGILLQWKVKFYFPPETHLHISNIERFPEPDACWKSSNYQNKTIFRKALDPRHFQTIWKSNNFFVQRRGMHLMHSDVMPITISFPLL